jgi:hypothetical protein
MSNRLACLADATYVFPSRTACLAEATDVFPSRRLAGGKQHTLVVRET